MRTLLGFLRHLPLIGPLWQRWEDLRTRRWQQRVRLLRHKPDNRSTARRSRQNLLLRSTAICAVVAILCSYMDATDVTERGFSYFEQLVSNTRMVMYTQRNPELRQEAQQEIVIVSLSDDTFAYDPEFSKLHGPPLPRRYHARVIRELTRAGARVIAFDMVFDIPKADDAELAAAARESGRILWASLLTQETRPNPTLLSATHRYGHVDVPKDQRHPTVDRIKAIYTDASGKLVPSLSLKAALMALSPGDQPLNYKNGQWRAGNYKLPVGLLPNGDLPMSFFGPPEDTFPTVPYENVYHGISNDPFFRENRFFQDKIVLIGDTTKAGNDLLYTPVGAMMGVELHAHAIATILQGRLVHAVPAWLNTTLIFLCAALVSALSVVRRVKWIALASAGATITYIVFNIWLFVDHQISLHMVGPLATIALATFAVLVERGFSQERERQHMFDSLVVAAASAIEVRDPTTSGHSRRVTLLTMGLAEAVAEQSEGAFKDTHFTPDQMRELSYACILHDFGKIGVRENLLVKSHKIEMFHFQVIESRLLLLRSAREAFYERRKNELLSEYSGSLSRAAVRAATAELEQQCRQELAALDNDLARLHHANDPTVTYLGEEESAEMQKFLERLGAMCYSDAAGELRPILTDAEKAALSIRKGTLSHEEQQQVQRHAKISYNFLSEIPWTDDLRRIPEIAYGHHEKLDGSGYPRGIKAPEIPLQTRMMTIADIYDALTAADRPYKKAVPVEQSLQILRDEAAAGRLDRDLLDLFISREVYRLTDPGHFTNPAYAA